MADDRPNILLLITDNQRHDTLGATGCTACRTPTWDRLAARGVCFDQMRTTSPVCSPARASMFTGQQPQQVGMTTIGFDYAENDGGTGGEEAMGLQGTPFSQHLRDTGYETLYVGKWHLGEHNIRQWYDGIAATNQAFSDYTQWCHLHGLPDGYISHDEDRARPYRSRHYPHMSIPRTGILDVPDDKEQNFWILGHAIELLESRRTDRPLCMTLSFEGPHPPLVVPDAYYNLYDPDAIEVPGNWGPQPGEPSFMGDSYYRKQFKEFGANFDAWRKSIAVYWGYTTYIDNLLGRFIDRCNEIGLLENTMVLMVSDHGEMLGQHGLNQKMAPYEKNLRVPCVISWPGVIEPGKRCGVDSILVDIAATVLAAANINAPTAAMEGENLLDFATGVRPDNTLRDVFSQWNMTPFEQTWHGVEPWRMIMRRPWKYTLHQNGEVELFQIEEDPIEVHNRAGEPAVADVESTLRKALLQWCRRTGDLFSDQVPPVKY